MQQQKNDGQFNEKKVYITSFHSYHLNKFTLPIVKEM